LTKGQILGVGFGKIQSQDLVELLRGTQAKTLRLMLERQLRIDGTPVAEAQGFVTSPKDLVMTAHACPGAPFCPQATVETMALAHRLAGQVPGSLHVSGCAKGCALPKAAALTLVGRGGKFDLVRDGAPWDTPAARDLRPSDLTDLTEFS
jgi:precorrin-3B synthase